MRTFNFAVLAILGLFFASCDSNDDHLGDWAKATQFGGAPREAAVCFTDEASKTVFVGLGYGAKTEEFADMYEFTNGSWKQIETTFPAPANPGKGTANGNGRHSAVSFVIGDYAYVGTGYVAAFQNTSTPGGKIERNRTYFKDFYRFNLKTKTWDAGFKTELPAKAEGRRDAVAFSDGTYGYVGTGYGENDRVFKDFYRYDPKTDSWTEIAFDGDARYGGTAFVIDNAAYVCLGASSVGSTNPTLVRDVMKFDFVEQTWKRMGALADKPGISQDKDYDRIPRAYAISFISDKGNNGEKYAYIACGTGSSSARTVWKYNHIKDQWHQMEDLSDYSSLPIMAVGFSVDGYGYYTTGASTTDLGGPVLYIETWRFIPDVKEDRKNDY